MSEMPQMYTVREFHEMFSKVEVSMETWEYWLRKWRNSTPVKLSRNIHWTYRTSVTIQYLPKPVFRLILSEADNCYFGSQFEGVYGKAIRNYLYGSSVSLTSLNPIDEPVK